MTRYIVTAEKKNSDPAQEAEQVQFLVVADGYKQAWVEGRNICRLGEIVPGKDDEPIEILAGMYTVRKVFSLEKGRNGKPKVITLSDFEKAAADEGLILSKRVLELIAKLKGDQPAEPAQEPVAA